MGVVEDFIAHLASETDEKKRAALLSRVTLKAANSAPPEAFKSDVRSLRAYLESDIEIPPSLVWPTIAVRGEITTTLGRAGKGKTTMNLNRIFAWAAGRALFPGWLNVKGDEYLKPEKPLRTLIAENEGNAGMFHAKMKTMLENGPLNPEERDMALDNIFVHGDGGYSGLKLDGDYNGQLIGDLRRGIEEAEPDIIFIEPFRSLWNGEENSATDMAKVIDNMIKMATEYQCAIILSHHERKSGAGDDGEKMSAGRGSTVLEGAVAVMENFESVKSGDFRELSWSKSRYLPPPPPVRMEYKPDSIWYEWVPENAIEGSIIQALREADDEPMNLSALADDLGETQTKLRKHMKALLDSGRVKKDTGSSNGKGSTGYLYRLSTKHRDGAQTESAGLSL